MSVNTFEFIDALVKWDNEPADAEPFAVTIAIGRYDLDYDHAHDERVFFYVADREELESLYQPNNGNDFVLVKEND
jgi:hypothetical protein